MSRAEATLDAVLFDFDGTLVPNLDLPGLRRRVTAFTLNCGVPPSVIDGRYIVEMVDAAADHLTDRDPGFSATYHARAHTIIDDFEKDAARRTRLFPAWKRRSTRCAPWIFGSVSSREILRRHCTQCVHTSTAGSTR